MRDITRRLCLIFFLFSCCFSAAIDSPSESKHLLGQDGHGVPPKNLHQEDENELYDDSLTAAKSTSDAEEPINAEVDVKAGAVLL